MRKTVEPINLDEANRYLGLSEIGLDGHYLGEIKPRTGRLGMFCVATLDRQAIAVFRPPVAASHNRTLKPCRELSQLWRANSFDAGERVTDRRGVLRPTRQLSAF